MSALPTPASPDRQRALLLWGGLAATLALTLWTALQPAEDAPADDLAVTRSQAARATPRSPGPASSAAASTQDPLPATRTAWAALGSAGRSAWTAPPAPAAPLAPKAVAAPRHVAEAPAPPQAPPPPFTLIGRYQDSRGPVALLATPQRTLAVREGELADPQWRVDAVAAQRIELTWLPGAQKRSLAYPPGT